MDIRTDITKAIDEALGRLSIAVPHYTLEHPSDLSHGDYALNVAMVAAKEVEKNPRELAEEIVAHIERPKGVERFEVAGPGFINITLARYFFSDSLNAITEAGERWGENTSLSGKKVMVEHTQPNPFKPFHIGHLMSNTIGESLSRLVENAGADIARANYQGDIGLHVAKALWAIEKLGVDPGDVDSIGGAYAYGHKKYEEDEQAKEEIIAINKKGYAEYKEWEVYKAGRAASLTRFEELYAMLGTRFDYYFFESECEPRGLQMVSDGKESGVFEESEGAVVYKGEKAGLHTRVFITKYGTTTYETRELGLASEKYEQFPFDMNLTTVAVEQDEYFKVVRAALEELREDLSGKYLHIPHGLMQLTTGKMSSRKGNVITGESLLFEMTEQAKKKMEGRDLGEEQEAIAAQVAVAAIKYQVLKQKTGKNIVFDPEKSLSFEGDSGPYLQYAHTRAAAILKKAKAERVEAAVSTAPEEVYVLEKLLYRFPEVVSRALEEREPHHITTYLTEIAGEFSSWYAKEQIVSEEDEYSPYKVALTEAFKNTMERGLWLLGIAAPERM